MPLPQPLPRRLRRLLFQLLFLHLSKLRGAPGVLSEWGTECAGTRDVLVTV